MQAAYRYCNIQSQMLLFNLYFPIPGLERQSVSCLLSFWSFSFSDFSCTVAWLHHQFDVLFLLHKRPLTGQGLIVALNSVIWKVPKSDSFCSMMKGANRKDTVQNKLPCVSAILLIVACSKCLLNLCFFWWHIRHIKPMWRRKQGFILTMSHSRA